MYLPIAHVSQLWIVIYIYTRMTAFYYSGCVDIQQWFSVLVQKNPPPKKCLSVVILQNQLSARFYCFYSCFALLHILHHYIGNLSLAIFRDNNKESNRSCNSWGAPAFHRGAWRHLSLRAITIIQNDSSRTLRTTQNSECRCVIISYGSRWNSRAQNPIK